MLLSVSDFIKLVYLSFMAISAHSAVFLHLQQFTINRKEEFNSNITEWTSSFI